MSVSPASIVARCEGIDVSVCAERSKDAWPLNECSLHGSGMVEFCYCIDGEECSCEHDAMSRGFDFRGSLYRGRGVCGRGVTR